MIGGPERPIKLIEPSVALADSAPRRNLAEIGFEPGCKAGYWYRAIRHAGETKPDPQRFAACCYPAEYGSSGSKTYIISEAGVVYEKDLGRGGGVDVYPANPEAEDWERVD